MPDDVALLARSDDRSPVLDKYHKLMIEVAAIVAATLVDEGVAIWEVSRWGSVISPLAEALAPFHRLSSPRSTGFSPHRPDKYTP